MEIVRFPKMRKTYSVVCACLLALTLAVEAVMAQESGPLLRVHVKGKWGFINRQGKVVIKPQFAFARGFSEGLAVVKIEKDMPGAYGFIDEAGRMVVPPQFFIAWDFSDGLARFLPKEAAVANRPKSGFVDRTGKVALEPIFENASDFSEGLASVGVLQIPNPVPKEPIDRVFKYGFINKTGNLSYLHSLMMSVLSLRDWRESA